MNFKARNTLAYEVKVNWFGIRELI
jgi:hypothetical protein